jgi:1-deoxy-D-xylulose-5-phosphate reductoisomerase
MSVVPFARPEGAHRASELSVTLLGATGSIGASTIDLLQAQRDRFRVEAVTAQRKAGPLAKLARRPCRLS